MPKQGSQTHRDTHPRFGTMTSENMNMSVTNSMDLSGRNPHNDTMVSNGNGEEAKGAAAAGGDPRDQAQG